MKKKLYLTLDTETATLPFADNICNDAKSKQKIAIAKPLVYDIGWVISDRKGNIIKTENFLVQETFFVPNIFNTAYYKDKRPIYINLIKENKIKIANWNDIISVLENDLSIVDIATAYNATFDFKKAIPFTEEYIFNLYSTNYNNWEKKQKRKCLDILRGKDLPKNKNFLNPNCKIRNTNFIISDLWSIACKKLINTNSYKNYCLENNLYTNSVEYFKTSAEVTFQYISKEYNFIEEHTALSDALIEKDILTKILQKGKIEPSLDSFPFKELGTTVDYVIDKKAKYRDKIKSALFDFIMENNASFEQALTQGYWARLCKLYDKLVKAMED